jgi:hypothetical protein
MSNPGREHKAVHAIRVLEAGEQGDHGSTRDADHVRVPACPIDRGDDGLDRSSQREWPGGVAVAGEVWGEDPMAIVETGDLRSPGAPTGTERVDENDRGRW